MQQSGQIARPAVTAGANVIGRSWLQQISDTQRRTHPIVPNAGAQFMFGVDAFIVNATIPIIARELHASAMRACTPRLVLFVACALFARPIIICAVFLSWMRRASGGSDVNVNGCNSGETAAHGLFILRCSNYLLWV